jgi:hypothetical protein
LVAVHVPFLRPKNSGACLLVEKKSVFDYY